MDWFLYDIDLRRERVNLGYFDALSHNATTVTLLLKVH